MLSTHSALSCSFPPNLQILVKILNRSFFKNDFLFFPLPFSGSTTFGLFFLYFMENKSTRLGAQSCRFQHFSYPVSSRSVGAVGCYSARGSGH